MNKKDYEALREALKKQREQVSSSPAAAKKFLKNAGVLHLLVPKTGKNNLSASVPQ